MAIIKPDVTGCAPSALMRIDDHEGPGGNDGFVTLSEIQAHRQSLEDQRDNYARTHSADSLWEFYKKQVEAVLLLEETIRSAEQWMDDVQVQYLPDEVANLQLPLRKRAIDILRDNDDNFDCHIDQTVLQRALDRYRKSGDPHAMAEVAVIGRVLGLKLPR